MNNLSTFSIMEYLNNIDPSLFFVLSLIPYIVFLIYAGKCKSIPKLSLLGFKLTVLFVFMTIVFAIISLYFYQDELTNIDSLHGAAEAFLTISDGVIAFGFLQLLQRKHVKNS